MVTLSHKAPLTWLCPLTLTSTQLLPEVGVDVNVVHALHGAEVAAAAHRYVAVDAVEVNGIGVVQLPPLADPGLLHQPAGHGHSLQLRDLQGWRGGRGMGRQKTWQDTESQAAWC